MSERLTEPADSVDRGTKLMRNHGHEAHLSFFQRLVARDLSDVLSHSDDTGDLANSAHAGSGVEQQHGWCVLAVTLQRKLEIRRVTAFQGSFKHSRDTGLNLSVRQEIINQALSHRLGTRNPRDLAHHLVPLRDVSILVHGKDWRVGRIDELRHLAQGLFRALLCFTQVRDVLTHTDDTHDGSVRSTQWGRVHQDLRLPVTVFDVNGELEGGRLETCECLAEHGRHGVLGTDRYQISNQVHSHGLGFAETAHLENLCVPLCDFTSRIDSKNRGIRCLNQRLQVVHDTIGLCHELVELRDVLTNTNHTSDLALGITACGRVQPHREALPSATIRSQRQLVVGGFNSRERLVQHILDRLAVFRLNEVPDEMLAHGLTFGVA
mmetsp:Transcript_42665/g.112589  ORF Transcript_42665/g.112589 Transcript_42665/m.112589 type:complete len:379 (+) Transcript_42665:1190-2326(+)